MNRKHSASPVRPSLVRLTLKQLSALPQVAGGLRRLPSVPQQSENAGDDDTGGIACFPTGPTTDFRAP